MFSRLPTEGRHLNPNARVRLDYVCTDFHQARAASGSFIARGIQFHVDI